MGTGKNSDKIKDYQRQIAQGFFYIGITVIVLTAVCIAWFVSNTKVTASGMTISAADDTKILLASTGERQKSEYSDSKSILNLIEGTEKKYPEYYDWNSKTKVPQKDLTLYAGTSGLAWYLNGQQMLAPGEGDTLEFYFIPQKENLSEISFKLTTIGKTKATSSSDSAALTDVTDPKAQAFLNSHLLFFLKKDETKGYRELLGKVTSTPSTRNSSSTATPSYEFEPANKTITVKATDFGDGNTKFSVDTPYKITIYWKWPKQFRNYVYSGDFYSGDLFTYSGDEPEPCSDQAALIAYLKDNKKAENLEKDKDHANENAQDFNKKEYYATTFFKKEKTEEKPDSGISIGKIVYNDVSQVDYNLCTDYYNQADEHIGRSIKYLYVRVDVESIIQ